MNLTDRNAVAEPGAVLHLGRPLRILLILPAAAPVRVTSHEQSVPRRAMLRFSVLPLTTVAALTPARHSVRLCDENVEPVDLDADCDVVGISFMTALAPRAYELAAEFRSRGKLVVGGGYHPTLCPEEAEQHFDAIVVGDAEPVWAKLLEDAGRGAVQKVYFGQVRGETFKVPAAQRELVARTAKFYATVNAVQAGRGCKHQCRYCSVTRFHGAAYNRRPVDDVVQEISNLSGDFIFVDDNIIAHRDFATALFRAIVPLGKTWVSQSSILIADDPELLKLAYQAGCRGLFIGIESVSSQNLAGVHKAFNRPEEYKSRLRRIRQTGIGVIAGIIVGLDADTKTSFEETLSFLETAQVDAVQVNILTPLPGTPLFQDLRDRILVYDWSKYDYRHVVFQPALMTTEELQAGADWLYSQFYRLDRILGRFMRSVFQLGWKPAFLGLKLGLTYRYDNEREGIVGWNPARTKPGANVKNCSIGAVRPSISTAHV